MQYHDILDDIITHMCACLIKLDCAGAQESHFYTEEIKLPLTGQCFMLPYCTKPLPEPMLTYHQ